MGFRVAAGVVLVALAVAVAAAIFALHSASNNSVPSTKGMTVQAYQKMVEDDNAAAFASWSSPCDTTVHSGCLADANASIPVVQKWLNDLNKSATPSRFAVVDAEMRAHLAQNLTALQDLAAASRAGDVAGIDRAYVVAVYAADWTGTVVPGITASGQVDAAAYVASVRGEEQTFSACATCTLVVSPQAKSCVTNDGVSCLSLFDTTAVQFDYFEMTLVLKAAPASLATKDARLQRDLRQADDVLLAIRLAVASNDQAGINSGIPKLQRIAEQIDQDASQITTG